MEFKDLINGLAEKMGVGEDIEIDAENRCLLEFDNMGVVIQGVDAAQAVVLLAPIGVPPPENPTQLYRGLLEANYLFQGTSGATLSVEPEQGGINLCRQLDARALDVEGLMLALDAFLNTLAAWKTFIDGYRPDKTPDSAPVENEFPMPALNDNFIRA